MENIPNLTENPNLVDRIKERELDDEEKQKQDEEHWWFFFFVVSFYFCIGSALALIVLWKQRR